MDPTKQIGIARGMIGAKKKQVAIRTKYCERLFATSISGPSYRILASC